MPMTVPSGDSAVFCFPPLHSQSFSHSLNYLSTFYSPSTFHSTHPPFFQIAHPVPCSSPAAVFCQYFLFPLHLLPPGFLWLFTSSRYGQSQDPTSKKKKLKYVTQLHQKLSASSKFLFFFFFSAVSQTDCFTYLHTSPLPWSWLLPPPCLLWSSLLRPPPPPWPWRTLSSVHPSWATRQLGSPAPKRAWLAGAYSECAEEMMRDVSVCVSEWVFCFWLLLPLVLQQRAESNTQRDYCTETERRGGRKQPVSTRWREEEEERLPDVAAFSSHAATPPLKHPSALIHHSSRMLSSASGFLFAYFDWHVALSAPVWMLRLWALLHNQHSFSAGGKEDFILLHTTGEI